MITDLEVNQLYLADTLPLRFPAFYSSFRALLEAHRVPVRNIPHTADIWCRDYMPVQVREERFVAFTYTPGYYRPQDLHLRTLTAPVLAALQLPVTSTAIVLDGGNLIRWKNKVICTDRIYQDNPLVPPEKLRQALTALLELDELIVIPHQPYDWTGHADGMLRFLDGHTVLVNDFSAESDTFRKRLRQVLRRHGLHQEVLPYAYNYRAQSRHEKDSARGVYINYLQFGQLLVVPQFRLKPDEQVARQMEQLFPQATIAVINAEEVARESGVLNCLSWAIKA